MKLEFEIALLCANCDEPLSISYIGGRNMLPQSVSVYPCEKCAGASPETALPATDVIDVSQTVRETVDAGPQS